MDRLDVVILLRDSVQNVMVDFSLFHVDLFFFHDADATKRVVDSCGREKV